MPSRPLVACAAALALALVNWAAADIIYVDDSATGASTGLTWADAHTNLAAGLAAAEPGDEIRIGQGTYRPAEPDGDRNATFEILESITLVGGYAGVGAVDPDANDPAAFPTILSGDLNDNDPNDFGYSQQDFARAAENAFHVIVIEAVGVVVQGVTIRDGHGYDDITDDHSAGGVWALDGSEATFNNCRIQHNRAILHGAGIYAPNAIIELNDCTFKRNRSFHDSTIPSTGNGAWLGDGSSVSGCSFIDNFGAHIGAGLFANDCTIASTLFDNNFGVVQGSAIAGENLTITDCTFTRNSGFGGTVALADSTIAGCSFTDNNTSGGTAIRTLDGSIVAIEDCVFRGNAGTAIRSDATTSIVRCDFIQSGESSSGGLGAAIFNAGPLNLAMCRFLGNAADRGGAIYNSDILRAVSCVFSGNAATESGGAIYNVALARIYNCTFAGNSCGGNNGGGALYNGSALFIDNSILWNNRDGNDAGRHAQAYNNDDDMRLRNCIVQGMPLLATAAGNIGANPLFRDADGPDNIAGTEDDDLRLRSNSPARDSGDNDLLPPDVLDLDGDANTAEPSSRDLDDRARIRHGTVDRGALEG